MSILHLVEFLAAYLVIVVAIGVPFGLGLFLILLAAYSTVEEWWLRQRAIKQMLAEKDAQ